MTATPRAGAAPARFPLGAWVAFAPLLALAGLRWVLAWLRGRADAPPAWPLAPFAGAASPWAWLHTAGWALLALALLAAACWWVRRRQGPRAQWRMLGALWVAAALAGCAAQLASFLNLRGLQPQPHPLPARVLGSHGVAPSARGPGGTLLVLQWPGAAVQQVLVPGEAAAGLRTGQALALRWATGRWWGRYATGWQPGAAPDNARP